MGPLPDICCHVLISLSLKIIECLYYWLHCGSVADDDCVCAKLDYLRHSKQDGPVHVFYPGLCFQPRYLSYV
jgi:hypothetical protein